MRIERAQLTKQKRERNMKDLIQIFIFTQIFIFSMWHIPAAFISLTIFNVCCAMRFKSLWINKKREVK